MLIFLVTLLVGPKVQICFKENHGIMVKIYHSSNLHLFIFLYCVPSYQTSFFL